MSSRHIIDEAGNKHWYNEKGQLHRDGDLPAVEYANGTKRWCKHGLLHRDGDKPAVENKDYTLEWYYNGDRHRDGDNPAVVFADGSKIWYKYGVFHREQDKPAIIDVLDQTETWFKRGKCLSPNEVEALKRKWNAIRNGDIDLLAEELLNEL